MTRTTQISVRLSQEERASLAELARYEERSEADVFRRLLRKALAERNVVERSNSNSAAEQYPTLAES